MIKLMVHHRKDVGDGTTFYSRITFDQLHIGDYYWSKTIDSDHHFRVVWKFKNRVLGKKV